MAGQRKNRHSFLQKLIDMGIDGPPPRKLVEILCVGAMLTMIQTALSTQTGRHSAVTDLHS